MRFRKAIVNDFSLGSFCPYCHRRVSFGQGMNIIARNGITVICQCKKGKVLMMPSASLLAKYPKESNNDTVLKPKEPSRES